MHFYSDFEKQAGGGKKTKTQQLCEKYIQSWNFSTVFGKGSNNDKAWLYRDINIFKEINVK